MECVRLLLNRELHVVSSVEYKYNNIILKKWYGSGRTGHTGSYSLVMEVGWVVYSYSVAMAQVLILGSARFFVCRQLRNVICYIGALQLGILFISCYHGHNFLVCNGGIASFPGLPRFLFFGLHSV